MLVHWIVNAGPYNFYMKSMHMEELLVNNSWEIRTYIHEELKDQQKKCGYRFEIN
jgi:hypothetical protein